MTHRERLLTALARGRPDRVPVTWELVFRSSHALTGRVGWQAVCDAHRLVGSAICNLQGVGPRVHVHWPAGYGEEEAPAGKRGDWKLLRKTLRTPKGRLTWLVASGGIPNDPLVDRTVEYLVKERSQYETVADHFAAVARNSEIRNETAQEAVDYVGDDGLVNFWLSDSLYTLAGFRDPAEFIIDLMEVPSLMHQILEAVHERTALFLHAFNESPANLLVWDSCWASTSLLNPRLAEEYVMPELRWAVASLRPGKLICVFVSGRMRDIAVMLADAGPDCMQHFDATGGGDCDLAEIKGLLGRRVCIMGNYNPVILARGTLEEARAEALRCLTSAGPDGYILSTADEVPADARLENMREVVRTAEEWTA